MSPYRHRHRCHHHHDHLDCHRIVINTIIIVINTIIILSITIVVVIVTIVFRFAPPAEAARDRRSYAYLSGHCQRYCGLGLEKKQGRYTKSEWLHTHLVYHYRRCHSHYIFSLRDSRRGSSGSLELCVFVWRLPALLRSRAGEKPGLYTKSQWLHTLISTICACSVWKKHRGCIRNYPKKQGLYTKSQ